MDWISGMRERENDSIIGWMELPLTELGKMKWVEKVRGVMKIDPKQLYHGVYLWWVHPG